MGYLRVDVDAGSGGFVRGIRRRPGKVLCSGGCGALAPEAGRNGFGGQRFPPPGRLYSREQCVKRPCLHAHLTNAARVKYQSVRRTLSALQRCKIDTSLLAAGYLISGRTLSGFRAGFGLRRSSARNAFLFCQYNTGTSEICQYKI